MRIERRLDVTLGARFPHHYLIFMECRSGPARAAAAVVLLPAARPMRSRTGGRKYDGGRKFDRRTGPKIWHALGTSGAKLTHEWGHCGRKMIAN